MDGTYILVVDDESRIRKLLKDFLIKESYSILEAADGEEALKVYEENSNKIKLILLDVMMPKLDGWSVLRQIRQSSKVPVIMLTAKIEDKDKIQGLTLGADDYITKPFNPLELIVRVKSASKGKVQLTMDQEVMHGATLQVTYAITVANVGEVDYKEDQFYYTGTVGDTSTIVKTNPRKLIDYVGTQVHEWDDRDDKTATRNNLQFNSNQNPEWQVITSDKVLQDGLVNKAYETSINKYTKDHIIVTEAISKDLIPLIADTSEAKNQIANKFKEDPMHALETVNASQSVSGVQLILTQMITQDNTNDDKTYNNMVELVTTKNTVGRKMAYSVVGNQDPTTEPYEIDADDSQDVVILPPFGNTPIFYVLISAVAFILIAGITITIVVLKKHK